MFSSPSIFAPDQFFSIVVSSYYRPFYLKRCLESIIANADMPVEVIVHDDGSGKAQREEIWKICQDKASTLISNLGPNMGLNIAANRAVGIAQSKYVLFINDDCFFTKGRLRKIAAALDNPWVGFISPTNKFTDLDHMTQSAVPNRSLGGGHAIAFRKDVWTHVGGWNENNTTGQSDNVFLLKTIRDGYMKAYVPDGNCIDVIHPNHPDYVPSFGFTKGNDCSYPKLFNFDEKRHFLMNHARREFCQRWVDTQRVIPGRTDGVENPVGGLNDFGYWGTYCESFINERGEITDWKAAELHGQSKWKDLLGG